MCVFSSVIPCCRRKSNLTFAGYATIDSVSSFYLFYLVIQILKLCFLHKKETVIKDKKEPEGVFFQISKV